VTYAQPPNITSAGASPNPVTGKTTMLTAAATDPNGGGGLIFTWSASGPAAVIFDSNNGTTAGTAVMATFSKAGPYTFVLSVKDSYGLSSSIQPITVTVAQTLTKVSVSPAMPSIRVGGTVQFTATALDQFGNALSMSMQPSFAWTIDSGPGTISSTGLYKGTSAGTAVVRATVTGMPGVTISGTATVTVRRHG
jgi:PKD repeat protein